MDPEANLKEMRELAEQLEGAGEDGVDTDDLVALARFVELFQAMDEWLKKGGFLPKDWERKTEPNAPKSYCEEYLVTIAGLVDALDITPHNAMEADYAQQVMDICETGYHHGRQGWYMESQYASDADWVHGVGAKIRSIEEKLDLDHGEVMDLYSEAHLRGLADGGHVDEDEG